MDNSKRQQRRPFGRGHMSQFRRMRARFKLDRRQGQAGLGLERLESREMLAAEPLITEFMARNDGGLRDANGRSSDWVEIFNAGDQSVNLEGYHLTDQAQQLDQWTFPSVNLDPGDYLVVFASGQENSLDADGNPHANFTLKRGGDYLALVAPDKTVVSEFGANGQNFPEQLTNTSYGIAQSTTLIDGKSQSVYLVPVDGKVDSNWRDRDFDALANGFSVGTSSLGLETRPNDRNNFEGLFETTLPDTAHAVYTRFEFDLNDAAAVAHLSMRLQYDNGFVAYLNGTKVAEDNAPPNPSWFTNAPDNGRRDSDVVDSVAFDLSSSVGLLEDGRNVLALHGLNSGSDLSDMLLVTELVAGASDLAAAFGSPARVGYLASATPGTPNPTNDDVFSGFVDDTKFSVDRGFYRTAKQVEITVETPDAALHYTTDGSTPGPDNPMSTLYSGPITIDSTTVLRAAAYKDDFISSNVDTQTYLFLSDVVNQTFQTAIDSGFPETWGRVPAEYGFDPDVVGPDDLFDGRFAAQLHDSLESLPTISLVTDFSNLFGETGILENTQRSGLEWERPMSMELLKPDGSSDTQIDAGIRIQGDASRDYSNAKKLSFRLAFRRQYGDTKLVYPLFGDGATDTFDTIRLRANYNDGSVHTPLSTQQIRDEWMRRTMLAMGQPNPHGTFMHVYLNGMYWGFYNVVERPDGSFSESYIGGDKEDWIRFRRANPRTVPSTHGDSWGRNRDSLPPMINRKVTRLTSASWATIQTGHPIPTWKPCWTSTTTSTTCLSISMVVMETGPAETITRDANEGRTARASSSFRGMRKKCLAMKRELRSRQTALEPAPTWLCSTPT